MSYEEAVPSPFVFREDIGRPWPPITERFFKFNDDSKKRLMTAIEHEIESVIGDMREAPENFCGGLCTFFQDEWLIYEVAADGSWIMPKWLPIIVAGVMRHKGLNPVTATAD